MADTNKGGGRIAIKFGSVSASPKPNAPPSSLGKRVRPNTKSRAFSGADSDSGTDDDRRHRGKHEVITGFGANGAETERKRTEAGAAKAEREYVIARQPNRDWRDAIKGKQQQRNGRGSMNILPLEARAAQNGDNVDTAPTDQDSGIKWGLTVKEPSTSSAEDKKGQDTHLAVADAAADNKTNGNAPTMPRTADEEAMDALLGKRPTKGVKVIITEEDAYARDVDAAGDASTLADYEAMPVEEFGAALLRGMGWNGEPRGAKRKEVVRRQNRLGLGAKELTDAEDLGAWNQKGGSGGPGGKKRPPRLADYRREEEKKKEGRRGGRQDSYKTEREKERENRPRNRDRDSDRDGHRYGHSHSHRHRHDDRDKTRDRDRDHNPGHDRDWRR